MSPLFTTILLVTLVSVSSYTTSPEPTTKTKTSIPVAVQTSHNAFLDHNISLAMPDRDGKRAVLRSNPDGSTSPLCDDGFRDLDATFLCGLVSYNRGKRTRKPTNKKFYGTNLSCSDKPGSINNLWKDGMKYKSINVTEHDLCTLELYTEKSVPCASTQALAIFCWDYEVPRAIDVAVDSIKTMKTKWSFVFKMYDYKHGRWFNVMDQAFGGSQIVESDFHATQCNETPPSFSMKIDKKTKQFAYSAKFVEDCDECVIMMFWHFELFTGYICPDYLYTLDADYEDGLEDAEYSFKDKN